MLNEKFTYPFEYKWEIYTDLQFALSCYPVVDQHQLPFLAMHIVAVEYQKAMIPTQKCVDAFAATHCEVYNKQPNDYPNRLWLRDGVEREIFRSQVNSRLAKNWN